MSELNCVPKCQYFGVCGGCSFQNVEYQTQLNIKKKKVAAKLQIDENSIQLFSGNPYNYRNKMEFLFGSEGIGLRVKNEPNKLVPIQKCEICDERINLTLAEVQNFFQKEQYDAFDYTKKTGTYVFLVIRSSDEGTSVSFVLNQNSPQLAQAIEKVKKFAENTNAKNVLITKIHKSNYDAFSLDYFFVKGEESISAQIFEYKLFYSAQGFFQNNFEVAKKMVEFSGLAFSKYDTNSGHLLDLYGGVGLFGISLNKKFKDVLVVEDFAKSIEFANKNAQFNGLKHVIGQVLDASKIKKLELKSPLYVLLDPPRCGMDEKTIVYLKTIKPKVIVYVSCNLLQLAVDLKKFTKYTLKSTAIFDMFPQTEHVETICVLELNEQM